MLYQQFIRLVEDHAESLIKEWIKEIKSNPSTSGYKNLNDDVLGKRVYEVYKRLGNWVLNSDTEDSENAEFFINLGRERAKEGLKNSEVVYALILARVVLWRYILGQGIINSSIALHSCLGFYQQLNNFFDKATYFVAVGYESVNKSVQERLKKDAFVDKAVKGITKWFIKT